jgi:hypothetical protein
VGGRAPDRTLGDGAGGSGGNASSIAEAVGAGVSAVFAKSEARGGSAGERFSEPGRDGDADARAHATGLGEATAWALARTDWPVSTSTPPPTAGVASARAAAHGASGSARAEAVAGSLGQLRAQSEALVASRRETGAYVARGVALADAPSAPDLHGSALLVGSPLAADVDAARAGNAALDALFEDEESATALALGSWHGLGDGDGPLLLSSELQIAFDEDQASRGLFLAAFGTSVVGDGFGGLDFSLEKNGLLLDVWSFDTTAELLAFFDDSLFALGAGWLDDDTLVARFDLEVTGETRVGMGFAFVQAVPEPGSAVLLAFGLLLLARRRRA